MTGCIGFKDFSHFVACCRLRVKYSQRFRISKERELKVKNKESNISVTRLFPEYISFSLFRRRKRRCIYSYQKTGTAVRRQNLYVAKVFRNRSDCESLKDDVNKVNQQQDYVKSYI